LITEPVSFLGISAVFLTLNSFVMMIVVFMLYSKDSLTILDVINKYIQEGSSASIEKDNETLEEYY
jgi:hypothetical protein